MDTLGALGEIPDGGGDTVPLTLTETDWNAEWKALQRARRRPDDPAVWDARAENFSDVWAPSRYRDEFIRLSALRPGESVFDMGCGNGMLALPLAAAGHEVVACDFSAGMLAALEREREAAGISGLRCVQMSWADDWAAHGVDQNCVDVAFASRSIVTADLADALRKLSGVARRRCCITMPVAASPRIDPDLLEEIGVTAPNPSSHLYAIMILTQLGVYPELSYIVSEREDMFASPAEAEETLGRMLRDALGPGLADWWPTASARLRQWLADNLVELTSEDENAEGRPPKHWKLRRPRKVRWAFIAWESTYLW